MRDHEDEITLKVRLSRLTPGKYDWDELLKLKCRTRNGDLHELKKGGGVFMF